MTLQFQFSAPSIAHIREIILAEGRDKFKGVYTCHSGAGQHFRPETADTYICLEDRGRQYKGTYVVQKHIFMHCVAD